MKTKKELRREILKLRDALTPKERHMKSQAIAEHVTKMIEFQEANKVLLYASYKNEVETLGIFRVAKEMSKEIYYPKVHGSEMEFYSVDREQELIEGYRGILEPRECPDKKFIPCREDKICVIMPGAAFDKEGGRIGYGKGFYDRFLQSLEEKCSQKNIHKVAVAFEVQMVQAGEIQTTNYDVPVDKIVTENQFYKIM